MKSNFGEDQLETLKFYGFMKLSLELEASEVGFSG